MNGLFQQLAILIWDISSIVDFVLFCWLCKVFTITMSGLAEYFLLLMGAEALCMVRGLLLTFACEKERAKRTLRSVLQSGRNVRQI